MSRVARVVVPEVPHLKGSQKQNRDLQS